MPTDSRTAAGGRQFRRRTILSGMLAGAFALASAFSGPSAAMAKEPSWVGTWMASPQPIWGSDFAFPTKVPASVRDQTMRQVVRISLGGSRIRLVFSNDGVDAPSTASMCQSGSV